MMDAGLRTALAEMGDTLGPQVVAQCLELYAPEQEPLAAALAPLATDRAYGPDPRNRLDLYATDASSRDGEGRAVLLFVHGGGFVLGDKGGPTEGSGWGNAHIGRWAARRGMLGAVMNYRLAPAHGWPSGAEDVAAAVAWLRGNAAAFGGDPQRIVVMGTSAGAVHIAGYLRLCAGHASDVRAAILLSGLYGYTGIDAKDARYYGDPGDYAARMPREALAQTDLPLFLGCARFDPLRFKAEWTGLLAERLARHGRLPWSHFANGHTHYTLALHIGTSDRALTDELDAFLAAHL